MPRLPSAPSSPSAPRGFIDTFMRIKLAGLVLFGAAATIFGWIACDRLAFALQKQEVAIATLGEPAHTLLSNPSLAIVPGVLVIAIAILGLTSTRFRVAAFVVGMVIMLLLVAALMLALVQALGPMYEYRAI